MSQETVEQIAERRKRARALAQECVLFGRLKGSQWEGLTELLVIFADAESAKAQEEGRQAALREAAALYENAQCIACATDLARAASPSPEDQDR